jgi:hypothetical protein
MRQGNCKNCHFWAYDTDAHQASGNAVGLCCVNPPTIIMHPTGQPMACQPTTGAEQWCGRHELDENAPAISTVVVPMTKPVLVGPDGKPVS